MTRGYSSERTIIFNLQSLSVCGPTILKYRRYDMICLRRTQYSTCIVFPRPVYSFTVAWIYVLIVSGGKMCDVHYTDPNLKVNKKKKKSNNYFVSRKRLIACVRMSRYLWASCILHYTAAVRTTTDISKNTIFENR